MAPIRRDIWPRKKDMKNPYEEIIQKEIDGCRLLAQGQTREDCCRERGVKHCAENDFSSTISSDTYSSYFVAIVLIILLLFTSILAWKKRLKIKDFYFSISEFKNAVASAWLIWIFTFISVILLFEPYGSSVQEDEILNAFMWFVLPPIAVIAVFLWYRRFIQ
ncbi:hypothetical protein GO003_021605 [Methylicorpusculum oleiharenae]|uniref:hypothetical protein n=1 Tax=Methylicorpusculum oleiharenae TaxID=1338687 RepID=UPI00135A1BDC|nr:hypothetical protein [Methylicorpusculum oleiharenae]MCD2452980.1 hypothetical protein [Methylicorpusculum oleiharenae]